MTSARAFTMSMGGPAYQAALTVARTAPLRVFARVRQPLCRGSRCGKKCACCSTTQHSKPPESALGLADTEHMEKAFLFRWKTRRRAVLAVTLISRLERRGGHFSRVRQFLRSSCPRRKWRSSKPDPAALVDKLGSATRYPAPTSRNMDGGLADSGSARRPRRFLQQRSFSAGRRAQGGGPIAKRRGQHRQHRDMPDICMQSHGPIMLSIRPSRSVRPRQSAHEGSCGFASAAKVDVSRAFHASMLAAPDASHCRTDPFRRNPTHRMVRDVRRYRGKSHDPATRSLIEARTSSHPSSEPRPAVTLIEQCLTLETLSIRGPGPYFKGASQVLGRPPKQFRLTQKTLLMGLSFQVLVGVAVAIILVTSAPPAPWP